jgi:site-specific DNA-cytosine methylase
VHTHLLFSRFPENRERLYIIGQKRTSIVTLFRFPQPTGTVKLSSVLEKHTGLEAPLGLHASSMLKEAAAKIGRSGMKVCVAIDIDSSKPNYMVEKSPCLTASRGSTRGYYLTNKQRKMTNSELLRIQGMNPAIAKCSVVSRSQLGEAIGNAMTQTVLEAILKALLLACGFDVKAS